MRYIGFDIMAALLVIAAAWLALQQYTNTLHYVLIVVLLFGALGMWVYKDFCKNKDKNDGV